MKRILFLLLIILISCIPSLAQDQIVNARNTSFPITQNLSWSSLANQAFLMAPIGPDYGFCVSIINNNPTNAHTFTVTAFQTGDSNVGTYSGFTGRYAPLAIVGVPSPIPANSTSTFYVRANGASKVAFVFTGGATLAGNPDTVDIFGVQTTASGCGTVNPQTGQQYTLSTANSGTSSTLPIQDISDATGNAYFANFSTLAGTIAANGNVLNIFNATGTGRTIYWDKLVISSSVAGSLAIQGSITLGVGCGAASVGPIKQGAGTVTVAQNSGGTCVTTQPTVGSSYYGFVPIAANSPLILDLRGFISTPNNNGMWISTPSGFAAVNLAATLTWYETK